MATTAVMNGLDIAALLAGLALLAVAVAAACWTRGTVPPEEPGDGWERTLSGLADPESEEWEDRQW